MFQYEMPIKPISLHKYYGLVKNRQYITKEGKEYQTSIRNFIDINYPNKICYDKPVSLYIEFGLTNKRKNDVDNLLKPLLDALNKIIYKDDSLIFDLHVRKFIQERDFINIEIKEMEI